jgi:hypothetical protein
VEQPGDAPAQRQLADVDPALAGVDGAMRDDLGCSAHTVLAVSIHVSRWPVTDAHPTATVEREALINDITTEAGLSADEASAAVEALTLRGVGLAGEGVQPWKGRARDHRLLTRPLVELADGNIMLLLWNTDLAGQVLFQYLLQGLLPWAQPRVDSLPRVKTALDQLRVRRTRVLEDETHQRLEALGFRVRSRVKPQHAHVLGMPTLPGEVDHVAAHPDGEIIWVIDDKALAEVFTPAEIARGVNTFHDPGGEIDKLRAKVAAVTAHTAAVSTSLALPERRRTVKGLFVTNHPVPAAFTTDQPIKFTVLSDLAAVLELPRP